jgi:hypothetical protein
MPRCLLSLLVTLAFGFLMGTLVAQAQQTGKLYRGRLAQCRPGPS